MILSLVIGFSFFGVGDNLSCCCLSFESSSFDALAESLKKNYYSVRY